MARVTRIILVEDHVLLRRGLKSLMESELDVEVVAEAGTAAEAIRLVGSVPCDLVLLDIGLPDRDGFSCLQDLVKQKPGLPILMLSMHTEGETVDKALRLGARGFLPKSAEPDELANAFRTVQEGGTYLHSEVVDALVKQRLTPAPLPTDLTEREREVLQRVARGLTNAEIGDELYLAESTIKTYLRNLYSKFRVANRSELVYKAMAEGLLTA